MARILLIGGHGKIALLASRLLVRDGHQVDSVIRNPDHADEVGGTGASAVVADVEHLETAAIADLASGHDVVVWSAGAGGGNPARTYAVDRDAAIRTVDAAQQAGVPRFVMVSYFGAGPDHGVPEDNSFFAYADAKASADEHLRASELDWVVLGPSSLTDEPGIGRVSVGDAEGGSVPRADVAAVVAAVLAQPTVSRVTYRFNSGDLPIADAVARAGGHG